MKKWHESKTVWFNIVALILGIIPVVGTFMKLIEPKTAVIVDGIVVLVAGIGNEVLRIFFTEGPIDSPRMRERWLDIYDEN